MGLYGRQWVYKTIINVLCMFSINIKMVHKPGSVILLKLMIINLEQMSPFVSSSLPEQLSWNWLPFLFDLAPKRVCKAFFVTKKAVSSYLTFSPLPFQAVYFLLHFPYACTCQVLPGFFSSGARTFLLITQAIIAPSKLVIDLFNFSST